MNLVLWCTKLLLLWTCVVFQSSPQIQSALAFYNFFTSYAILGYCNPILSIFFASQKGKHSTLLKFLTSIDKNPFGCIFSNLGLFLKTCKILIYLHYSFLKSMRFFCMCKYMYKIPEKILIDQFFEFSQKFPLKCQIFLTYLGCPNCI